MVQVIGETAGKVWNVLDEKDTVSIAQLKKATGADEKSLWLALGWLAREDKVDISKNKSSYKIHLR